MNANEFIAGLASLQSIAPLEPGVVASKRDLLAAEVSLPLAAGVEVSSLRLTLVRPPYHRTVEELLALTFRVFCKPAPGDVKDGQLPRPKGRSLESQDEEPG